jgi:hypothetical protein
LDYQEARSTSEQVETWYRDGLLTGIGTITGKVSGNLEMFEFDDHDIYTRFCGAAKLAGLGDLVDRVEAGYSETTPNGIHWFYRCDEIAGNEPLAARLKTEAERKHAKDNKKVLIETRGEGGFAILAPSHGTVHPSGKPYKIWAGVYATIVTITPDEREQLFALAKTFDEMPRREVRAPASLLLPSASDAETPGNWYARNKEWQDVLGPGWTYLFTHGGESYWCRPGKLRGVSATTNYKGSDSLKVFSTSTEFETDEAYSKFGAYAHLKHGDDFIAAARAIRVEMMPREQRSGMAGSSLFLISEPAAVFEDDAIENEMSAGNDAGIDAGTPDYRRLRSRILTTKELLELPPPEWLIDGVVPKKALVVVWGAPGSYKSFLGLDWALSIATGQWWKGRAIKEAGGVFYVAAEGTSGIPKRIRSWSKSNQLKNLERAMWLPEAVNLLIDLQYQALLRIVGETGPLLTVVDTLARSMVGGDENSAQDMGRLIERADNLKSASGGAVVLIHHSTKEGSSARGSGSLKGNVDVEIEVKKDGSDMVLFSRKQKDAADFAPISLHLVVVDESCVLQLVSQSRETSMPSSHALETSKRVFRETFSATGVAGTELRNVLIENVPCSRATSYRLVNELLGDEFIVNRGTSYRPFYEAGENFDGARSSQRLTNVSERLKPPVQTSHALSGALDPESETRPDSETENEPPEDDPTPLELW